MHVILWHIFTFIIMSQGWYKPTGIGDSQSINVTRYYMELVFY